jgi:two-component system, NtrC family, sensor kinase
VLFQRLAGRPILGKAGIELIKLFYSTRIRLISSFVGVSLLVGIVCLLVGGQLIYQSVLTEANNRVRMDLNAAREIYENRARSIELTLTAASLNLPVPASASGRDEDGLQTTLTLIARNANLDFLGLISADGKLVTKIGPASARDRPPLSPVASLVLKNGRALTGTVVLDETTVWAEDPKLASRAEIKVIPTARSSEKGDKTESAALCLVAAVPVGDAQTGGVLYGGILLNRDRDIVDRVSETVFRGETYHGRNVGTATIFLKDLRVATTVTTGNGNRAIGTRASDEVSRAVLDAGGIWTDRAFVVNDWYITAYEPIEDVVGRRVGMLYVGVLEAPYVDVRRRAILVFTAITLAGVAVAGLLGSFLSDRIMRPLNQLIQASISVSQGDFFPNVGPMSPTDLGQLQSRFRDMAEALRLREQAQKEESEFRLVQSEKQAHVGRLAAGVAHEINNPLTAVLTFTHLLLRRDDLTSEVRADLEMIAMQTNRVRNIVKGLLDYARQTRIDPAMIDLNGLLRETAGLMENQALVKGVELETDLSDDLPGVVLDRSQMQAVVVNLVINALDATRKGGRIVIKSCSAINNETGEREVEVIVEDTGCGIPPENLDKLFDPFFTTKEVGKGTGLGLAVSAGIVAKHGGSIQVRSQLGVGSAFIIRLPIAAE